MSNNNLRPMTVIASASAFSLACFLLAISPHEVKTDITKTDHSLTHSFDMSLEEGVRRFDNLCVKDTDAVIYARFLPNKYDYNTKLTPNSPVTKGEHIREMLITTRETVVGFIDEVERKGIKEEFVLLQKKEMVLARQAFEAIDQVSSSTKDTSNLSLCSLPFPKP